MDGFGLLVGHLIGDYIVQNDWMAANKTNCNPGSNGDRWCKENNKGYLDYWDTRDKWIEGHIACTIHCLLYTLSVWVCSFWWLPWWGVVACFFDSLARGPLSISRMVDEKRKWSIKVCNSWTSTISVVDCRC